MPVHTEPSKREPPPPAEGHVREDETEVHREVVASMKRDRLVYADELGRWLSAIGTKAWPTRRARRLLSRGPDPIGYQLGRRGPWVTTWGALYERYPRLTARILSHVGGDGDCPVCGRSGELEGD